MTQSLLGSLLTKNHVELKDLRGKSASWFRAQIADMRKITTMKPESFMRGDVGSKGNMIVPGHMYMFVYDPKHKETLPYYDTFPLVFPFAKDGNSFTGLNLHYLPYDLRAKLLDRLLEFRNNTKMDEHTKLRFSWQVISGVSKFAIAAPCVKKYLFSHVQTQFKAIHSSDWATAMLLPVEQFRGASVNEIWRNSTNAARKV
jgi:hypothetical protein